MQTAPCSVSERWQVELWVPGPPPPPPTRPARYSLALTAPSHFDKIAVNSSISLPDTASIDNASPHQASAPPLMSTFTKFAVVGAGGVGSSVVDGLLKANAIVTILTRDDTKPELQTFKERGASIVKANYDDEASLQGALADSEVVVCTVDARHHAVQFGIARAAKAAGVQLFVPTEFGMPDEDGANVTKQKVRGMLKELDLPYALFFSGFWFEYLPFVLGFNFEEGVMSVIGEGNAKLGLVSRTDFGRFVAHVLVTAPKASLEWAQFSIESNRMSPKEIAAMAEKKFGKKIELKVVDYEATKKNYDTDSVAYILTRIGDGRCVPGTEEEVKKTIKKKASLWLCKLDWPSAIAANPVTEVVSDAGQAGST
ncbi:hypothetical protein ON010_g13112 [Phytophthora cinnamomi]|nr:hypothetical protein ON010_g13112 [Phytophthora cinnamomi]